MNCYLIYLGAAYIAEQTKNTGGKKNLQNPDALI